MNTENNEIDFIYKDMLKRLKLKRLPLATKQVLIESCLQYAKDHEHFRDVIKLQKIKDESTGNKES